MDNQLKLAQYDKSLFGTSVVKLKANPLSLEQEKEKFISAVYDFVEPLNFEVLQFNGRPKSNFKSILKSLLIMSFNNMSYRRTQSDLRKMYEQELIRTVIPRSTLNDYANDENTKKILEKLIRASALFFNDDENTLIIDSTWLAKRMYSGGYKKVYDKVNANFEETRKLHIGCLKNSRIIACAITTEGKRHDNPIGREIIEQVTETGFNITTLLADAGYLSKETYALCKEKGILNTYINFKKNSQSKRAKSDLWQNRLKIWKEQPEVWHETYRYRVLVEGIFSAIKRKNINYLRSKKETAQDVELLLKVLVYNLTIIAKYS